MPTKCDPKFRKELNQISAEIGCEDDIADLSEQMEAQEMLDKAYLRCEAYGDGFLEGFNAGRELYLKYDIARDKSIHQKHDALNKRWGLDKL